MNAKACVKMLIKAPFRMLGADLVRWRPQPVLSPEEMKKKPVFGPQHKPEEHWIVAYGIKTVLDVGAHMGEFACRIRAILPDAGLVCFEPLQHPFSKLREQFEGDPNFRAVNCALGDMAGQFGMHHNEFSPSSSLLPMADLHKKSFPFAVEEKAEVIEVRRLSDVAREMNLQYPLLLKLDVQGYEDKVIAGGEDVVARATIIIVEVSYETLYDGGPLFDDIYRILKARGFTYRGNFEQVLSPKDSRALQGDAIFCR